MVGKTAPWLSGLCAVGVQLVQSWTHLYTGTHRRARCLPLWVIIYVHKILIRKGNGVTYRISYRKMKMKESKVGRYVCFCVCVCSFLTWESENDTTALTNALCVLEAKGGPQSSSSLNSSPCALGFSQVWECQPIHRGQNCEQSLPEPTHCMFP